MPNGVNLDVAVRSKAPPVPNPVSWTQALAGAKVTDFDQMTGGSANPAGSVTVTNTGDPGAQTVTEPASSAIPGVTGVNLMTPVESVPQTAPAAGPTAGTANALALPVPASVASQAAPVIVKNGNAALTQSYVLELQSGLTTQQIMGSSPPTEEQTASMANALEELGISNRQIAVYA